MPSPLIEIKGDKEILARTAQFPRELDAAQHDTMEASLLTLWENVPPYPEVDNPVRDGTLGKSLGVSMQGSKLGKPEIYENKKLGGGYEGRFGTKLEYAEYVIGEKQAWFHYRWWLIENIKKAAEPKILRLWNTMAEKLAKFIDGKG